MFFLSQSLFKKNKCVRFFKVHAEHFHLLSEVSTESYLGDLCELLCKKKE
jgi:hypothetical protein